VGKYSSELWAWKQAQDGPPAMPEIKDYRSTLAASKLIILLLEILKFSKILFLTNIFF
jgi:hypothetical protein